jgi:hypothetical protein
MNLEAGIRHLRRIRLAAAVLILFILITSTVLALKAWARFNSTSLPTGRTTVATQNQPQPVRIARALVTIRPFGFEPADITRPAGPFLLEVHNRSGLREVVLRIDREAGNRLYEERVPRRKLDWRTIVNVPPGRYLLTEEGHPTWVCRITITTP